MSWLYLGVQLALGLACLSIGYLVAQDLQIGAFLGAAGFLVYSRGSKTLLLRHHQAGMRLVRAGRFEAAVRSFERSYEFLSRHPWIDEFRVVTMLSLSKASYREMALVNAGYSLLRLERFVEARAAYERVRVEYPDSPYPDMVLRLLDAPSAPAGGTV